MTASDRIQRLWLEHGFTALLLMNDVSEAVTPADRAVLIEDHRIALDERVALLRPRSRGHAGFGSVVRWRSVKELRLDVGRDVVALVKSTGDARVDQRPEAPGRRAGDDRSVRALGGQLGGLEHGPRHHAACRAVQARARWAVERGSAAAAVAFQAGLRGSRTVNTVPASAEDSTATVPPCPSTISRTMKSPSPRLVFERS